jgi:hypothetical protein
MTDLFANHRERGAEMLMPVDPDVQMLHRRMRRSSLLLVQLADLQLDIEEQVKEMLLPGRPKPGAGPTGDRVRPASELEVWESPSGRLTFSFDLQRPFYLQRRLGKMLVYLATESGQEHALGPEIVSYRKRSEILAHIQRSAKPGKEIPSEYVNKVTYLLRAKILKHTGRDLITSHDELGVAILLKIGGLRGLENTSAHKWL